jgi:hypothetical protein
MPYLFSRITLRPGTKAAQNVAAGRMEWALQGKFQRPLGLPGWPGQHAPRVKKPAADKATGYPD